MNSKKEHLKAWINRILEDKPPREEIRMEQLLRPRNIDISTICNALTEWENDGYLKILKDPNECRPEEACIKMYCFIEQKSPIKGFLNWEK